ncbi:MAG: aspartate/glutamate racemase family protein [Burkholderiales bacterium]
MNKPRIALIHATPVAIEPIVAAFRRNWPEAQTTNLLEDSLASDLSRDGRITDAMNARFSRLARYAVDCGADAVLFTCSAFGTSIEHAAGATPVPVLKPNEAMIEDALAAGTRIGLLATFEPSLPSMQAEFEAMAKARGIKVELRTKAVPAAMQRLLAGDPEGHDALIAEGAKELADCEVLMLGQFSMASAASRVAAAVPTAKILTSPDSAIARLRAALKA